MKLNLKNIIEKSINLKDKIIKNFLINFFLFYTIISLTNSMWQTLFPLFLNNIGFSLSEAGLINSLISIIPMLLSLPIGVIVDEIDWKFSLIMATIILIISITSINYINQFYIIILITIFIGLALSIYTQTSISIISYFSKVGSKGKAFAKYYFLIRLTTVIGSILSGFIVSYFGYTSLNTICVIISLIALIFLLIFIPKENKEEKIYITKFLSAMFKDNRLRILILSLMIHDFSAFMVIPYIALYAKHYLTLNEEEIGLIIGIQNLGSLLTQIPIGKLIDKIGGSITLLTHVSTISMVYILYAFSGNFYIAALVLFLYGSIIALDFPARRYLLTKYVPQEYIATVSGSADTFVGLATCFSPLVSSFIWYNFGGTTVFLLTSILNIFSIPSIIYLKTKKTILVSKTSELYKPFESHIIKG
jgi:predicted MFS family arabinose efflux permease